MENVLCDIMISEPTPPDQSEEWDKAIDRWRWSPSRLSHKTKRLFRIESHSEIAFSLFSSRLSLELCLLGLRFGVCGLDTALRDQGEHNDAADGNDVRQEVPRGPDGNAATHVENLKGHASVLHGHPREERATDVVHYCKRVRVALEVAEEDGVRVRVAILRVVEVWTKATADLCWGK